MQQTRAYKFRIYPDAKRQEEIDEMLIPAQEFYNKLLEKSMQSYKNGNCKISMAQLNRFANGIIKATSGKGGSHAQGENVRPQQEAVLEEPRTDKNFLQMYNAKEAHGFSRGRISR